MNSVNVIGRGRVGSAVAARLASAASSCATTTPSSCCSACPTARSPRSPPRSSPGPWVAHVCGATPLAALDPHARRFCVHPLQTFTLGRGPEQLDGAWAAVTAETDEARARGCWLAETLGLRPFDARRRRPRRSTTRAPRSPPTTSSRSTAPPRASSRTPARRPRRSCR